MRFKNYREDIDHSEIFKKYKINKLINSIPRK